MKYLIPKSYTKSRYFRCGFIFIILLLLFIILNLETGEKPAKILHLSRQENVLWKDSARVSVSFPKENKLKKLHPVIGTPGTESGQIKLLCYLLLARSRVKAAKIIKETWGTHCDALLFFGGYKYPELGVTYLNVTEGYENLWGKAKAAIIYLSEHRLYQNFQYYLKADDDTFVIVENLRKFIEQKKQLLREPSWFGFKLKHHKMPLGYMSGGAGYVFNNAALVQVSRILKSSSITDHGDCNVEGEYGIEDLELGKCFLSVGVKSVDSTDAKGRERFLPLSYDTFLNGAITSFHWIWSQAWNRIKTGESCCSEHLISMHEVSPIQLKTIYNLLYKIQVKDAKAE